MVDHQLFGWQVEVVNLVRIKDYFNHMTVSLIKNVSLKVDIQSLSKKKVCRLNTVWDQLRVILFSL